MCYETNSQNKRKDRSTSQKLSSLRGKPPLHYINEKLFDDTNEKTFFLYIGVQWVKYNPSRHKYNDVREQQ